jgi:hypothetical protein
VLVLRGLEEGEPAGQKAGRKEKKAWPKLQPGSVAGQPGMRAGNTASSRAWVKQGALSGVQQGRGTALTSLARRSFGAESEAWRQPAGLPRPCPWLLSCLLGPLWRILKSDRPRGRPAVGDGSQSLLRLLRFAR